MIDSVQIAQESWPKFFDAFSAGNQGRSVGIKVVDEKAGEERITEAAPLLAVDYDPAGKGNDIVIATGVDTLDYTHTIIAPTEVWDEEDEDGNVTTLEIIDQSGGKTVVRVNR